jgi:hypothetical protein
VRSEVKLAHPDGHLVPEFLLHIDGTEGVVEMERRALRG